MNVIEIDWDGPFPMEAVMAEAHAGPDYGIYQLYGTHTVFGPDSLLYLGKAQDRPFAVRMREHFEDWGKWEASPVNVYLGRLGGTSAISDAEWIDQIARAESLLIYFSTPPYNSSGLKTFHSDRVTVVLNHRRRHRLPPELSTLLWSTPIGTAGWRRFGGEDAQPSVAADVPQAARR
jgi:hypothetical protein